MIHLLSQLKRRLKEFSLNTKNNHRETSTQQINKITYVKGIRCTRFDLVIAEQPLQIRLYYYLPSTNNSNNPNSPHNAVLESRVFSITMRTPGHDKQLIIGLLLSEGVIKNIKDIDEISIEHNVHSANQQSDDKKKHSSLTQQDNLWEVKLNKNITVNIDTIDRYQLTYSSCGLCGTTSLKSLELKSPPCSPQNKAWLDANILGNWPDIMREQQEYFHNTGGSHGAALFDQTGNLLDIKEDIGRHNAVDKLIGELIMNNSPSSLKTSDQNLALVISSRVSFEIVQKTIMAGIGVLIAVGAVSNLAILAAKRFDLTLIGFTTSNSFNLYHGEWRLK
ncbi:formate dehydrogenase accessory sulfurtransferase FdhD [Colwelliaceae bacterium 6441]